MNLENLLFKHPKQDLLIGSMIFFVDELKKKKKKKNQNRCLKHSLLVFDYQISCTLLHKTLLICLNIFRDNTVIVAICDSVLQITFSNKKLNKLCDTMRNSFRLNTHFFLRRIYFHVAM